MKRLPMLSGRNRHKVKESDILYGVVVFRKLCYRVLTEYMVFNLLRIMQLILRKLIDGGFP